MASNQTHDGGCTCRHVRYRMTSKPLFVHCCHCRWCQRESGSAFALNAMIEAERVQLRAGEVEVVDTPSNSDKGQKIARCPHCRVALWSHYAGAGDALRFVVQITQRPLDGDTEADNGAGIFGTRTTAAFLATAEARGHEWCARGEDKRANAAWATKFVA